MLTQLRERLRKMSVELCLVSRRDGLVDSIPSQDFGLLSYLSQCGRDVQRMACVVLLSTQLSRVVSFLFLFSRKKIKEK